MSPSTAFENASGGGVTEISYIVVGLICASILLWAAWSLLSVYVGWARTRVRDSTFQFAVVRIVVLSLVILWIVLSNY